ncbi:MAG: DUF4942 domain-containing protein [Pseudomonas sp.]|uniref:DUF4942 domain-containing protein n=1 Tax=Pseudomonas sp. TaxID=306 RepID=UPI003242CAFE
MSPFKEVALPTTLTDLLKARADALRLIEDARRLIGSAETLLAPHGRYLMPRSGMIAEDEERVRRDMDERMWRRAFDLTGFKQLMDAQAVSEFEKSLNPSPPEFTEANIRSTFIKLRGESADMFRRGVVNVFRGLSDDYKTNSSEPFRIGRKVVMGYMVEHSFTRGLCIRYGNAADKINDIDRVFQTLDNKQFKAHELVSALNVAFKERAVYECDLYRAKAFKNGNIHLEFKRPDLLDKLNEQIADHYANTLPDARF